MDKLRVDSVKVQDFKNLRTLQIVVEGDHIVLSGPSGAGKTAIKQALEGLFWGKRGLPKGQLIRAGAEGATVEVMLSDGRKASYRATMTVKQADDEENVYWRIKEIGKDGRAKAMSETPLEFFKRIASEIMFDAKKFFASDDQEVLGFLYNAVPGLREKLQQNDEQHEQIRGQRSITLQEVNRLKVGMEQIVIQDGIPEEEIDPAAISKELAAAMEHNAERDRMDKDLCGVRAQLDRTVESVARYDAEIRRKQEMIDQLQKDLLSTQGLCDDQAKLRDQHVEKAGDLQRQIAAFVAHPVDEIRGRLDKMQATNAAIRQAQDRARKIKQLEQAQEQASQELQKMREVERARAKIMSAVQIPVPGLTIGDGCLMYPDPKSMMPMRLSALSDGQKWPIVTALYAAYSPGLKLMYVDDYTAIDAQCRKAMFDAADTCGLQLLIHNTTQTAENQGIGIMIVGGEISVHEEKQETGDAVDMFESPPDMPF